MHHAYDPVKLIAITQKPYFRFMGANGKTENDVGQFIIAEEFKGELKCEIAALGLLKTMKEKQLNQDAEMRENLKKLRILRRTGEYELIQQLNTQFTSYAKFLINPRAQPWSKQDMEDLKHWVDHENHQDEMGQSDLWNYGRHVSPDNRPSECSMWHLPAKGFAPAYVAKHGNAIDNAIKALESIIDTKRAVKESTTKRKLFVAEDEDDSLGGHFDGDPRPVDVGAFHEWALKRHINWSVPGRRSRARIKQYRLFATARELEQCDVSMIPDGYFKLERENLKPTLKNEPLSLYP